MRTNRATFAAVMLLLIAAFGCGKKPSDVSGTTTTTDASSAAGSSSTADSSKEAPKPPSVVERLTSRPITLPEGTVFTVRLNETVSSKSNSSGDRFTGTVEEPVEVGGKVVIPKGAEVTGTVTDAQPLGKIKGAASLRLVLNSVTVKDARYNIETSAVARSMKGKGKRTAEIGGGGAALGGIIGGLAGGGKGAAVGILAGGGAGVAGGAFTGNKDIVLPAETMLSFRLLKPVEVKQ
jgi:hypothetical protein